MGSWLDAETRERCFTPAYCDLLQEHLEHCEGQSPARRWMAAAGFHIRVLWLVAQCLRLRSGAARRSPAKKGDKIMTLIWQDIRYAARGLRKSPGFSIIAVLTLALGIGANTAIFSVVDTVLLRPLQFRDPDRLVALWETDRADGNQPWRVAPANYRDWREQADVFEDVAAFGAYTATLTGQGEPAQLKGGVVSANYFSVLGVQPVLGRTFQPSDQATGEAVAVIGYGL